MRFLILAVADPRLMLWVGNLVFLAAVILAYSGRVDMQVYHLDGKGLG